MNKITDIDLEDGELPSSDDEQKSNIKNSKEDITNILDCGDYVVTERPLSLTKSIIQQSSTGLPGLSTKWAKNSVEHNSISESEKSTSSSSDDSEDDFKRSKKRRMVETNKLEVISKELPSNDSESLSTFQKAAQNLQNSLPRKVNNIWADVIQDEQAADLINQLGVNNAYTVERGSESFVIHNIRKRKRTRADSVSSEISSGGLSDNAKEYLRSYNEKSNESSRSVTPAVADAVDQDSDLPAARGQGHRSRSKKRAKRRERKSDKHKIINKLGKMDDKEFANYIIYTLNEPKQALIFRVVSILGRETAERVFLKTLKIQRRGGLYIRNQARLRTAGGVFLYLLRGDDKISGDLVDKVFELDKQQTNKLKKKTVDKRRRQIRYELHKNVKARQPIQNGKEALCFIPRVGLWQRVNVAPDAKKELGAALWSQVLLLRHNGQLLKRHRQTRGNIYPLPQSNHNASAEDDDGYLNSSDEAKIQLDSQDEEEDESSDEDCLDIHCDASDLVL